MSSPKLELISRKFIKPSFSTSPSSISHKLSIIDQLMPNKYLPIAFFYPNINNISSSNNISTLLENSLSKILALYYPLAGKLVDNLSIDCNEMGATFIEANANCQMSSISRNPNINAQDVIFPSGLAWRLKHDERLLVAQLTHFDCGGISISLCISHKVGDGLTLCNFARDWADLTKHAGDHKSSSPPPINVASILPPIEDASLFKDEIGLFKGGKNCITKRYMFTSKKLSQLKTKGSIDTGIHNLSRVELVTTLLIKCAIVANSTIHQNSNKIPIIIQPINIRSFIDPLFSQNYVGNIVGSLFVPLPNGNDFSFATLVSELRRIKAEYRDKFKGMTANEVREEFVNLIKFPRLVSDDSSNLEFYTCSSLCKFLLYDIDFGWGKPEGLSGAACPYKNIFYLMDDQNGDGIEAFVSLEEKVMDVFGSDPELLEFASLGSSMED